MEVRRGRRTLLPLRRTTTTAQHSATISCWYCDYKFLAFNEPLFRFGRKYARYLRVWFSMGTGFTMAALVGVTLLILFELVRALLVFTGHASPGNSLSGVASLITGLNISLPGVGYLCVSSVICLFIHEFGHALAAASEGIQMEYLAVFLAGLFPGALVAFNHASLHALPGVASLRIYCAGIWHNATFCAVCTIALFLLPLILNPFYIYGESPMVLDVPSTSPLSGYLSTGDLIFSLNNMDIRTAEDWKQSIGMLIEQSDSPFPGQHNLVENGAQGYCVPNHLIEQSTRVHFNGNQTYCPNELMAFSSMSCLDLSNHINGGSKNNYQKIRENIRCLDAKDVVKLKRCAFNNLQESRNTSGCVCSEDESCSTPVQLPGLGWIEITYSSLKCRSLFSAQKNSSNEDSSCVQSFVFVGDLITISDSIHLTSYQPRWSIHLAPYLPNLLEKFLTCSFHVSLILALLNSLPVFFLDGESILEVIIMHHFSYWSSRKKRLILRCCLLVGTFISTCFILQSIFLSVSSSF